MARTKLPTRSNEARKKLIEYFGGTRTVGNMTVDHLLTWLYIEGYAVTPIKPKKPARRAKRKIVDVSPWIGTSHNAKLAGQ